MATYDVVARGIRAGEFTFRFTRRGDVYQVDAERRLTGMLRRLAGASQDYRYSVHGKVEDGQLKPSFYRHSGGKKGRVVESRFTPDDIVTTASPPMSMGEPPATKAQRRGAVDQLSAIAKMIVADGDVCDRTVSVYMDGRSRFDFVMRPDGKAHVDTGAFKGEAYRCRVDFRPIAGFGDPQEPAELTFLFAPTSSGLHAPVRIEMPTEDIGTVVLEARRLTVDGAPLQG